MGVVASLIISFGCLVSDGTLRAGSIPGVSAADAGVCGRDGVADLESCSGRARRSRERMRTSDEAGRLSHRVQVRRAASLRQSPGDPAKTRANLGIILQCNSRLANWSVSAPISALGRGDRTAAVSGDVRRGVPRDVLRGVRRGDRVHAPNRARRSVHSSRG